MNPNNKTSQSSMIFTIFSKRVLLALAMALAGMAAKGQDLYIIHNGGNYLSHDASSGAVNTTRVTTFDPTTCFWTITTTTSWGTTYYYLRPVNSSGAVLGNLYLRERSAWNTYSLNTSTSTDYANWYGLSDGGQPYNNRYLRLNGTTWEVSNQNSNRGTLRLVEVSTVQTTSTNPTINGADVITGNSDYTASGAAYQQGGYTNYHFNNTDHFFNGNTSITPAAATISGYSWDISSTADVSISGTTSTGSVTVNTLPTSDTPATITVTVSFTDGTPAVPDGTTLTGTKTITILGTKPSAPIIEVSGTTVTISTDAVGETSIRYTLDGTDPTATTGTVYSGAIDLSTSTTSPVTVKAVTVRNNVASTVAEETVTLTLPEPVINVNGSAGTATISCSVSNATIYYTLDGSTPSATNGTEYDTSTGISGLTMMQTIKAIAVKDGWNDSPVASATVTIPSGVSEHIVTLFDYEDHNFSYYQPSSNLPTGYPAELHSPDPRNVKITYKGNGQYTNGNAVSGVKVGVDADAHTFVYYKTLEKGADNKYAYTTIPNPFSVRPKNGSTYYGFSHWKVTSITGGTIDGSPATINAETEIKFVPSGTYTVNCTSIEVTLEAVWDVAEVSTNGTFTNNYGVERMFYVVSSSTYNNLPTANKACTYSSFYPNGTIDGTHGANLDDRATRTSTFTAPAHSKIEYIILRNNNSTISGDGYNFTIGRGVSGYVNGLCATTIQGLSSNSTTSFRMRIESGSYDNLYFMGARGMTSGVLTAIVGSDYDRANNKDNSKLRVYNDIAVSNAGTVGANNNIGADCFHCTVKSGNYYLTSANPGGNYQFYISSPNGAMYGKRTLIIEGGYFADISGGFDTPTSNPGKCLVDIRVKGGQILGALYGAAQYANAAGDRKIIITGGDFEGWIAGGANGTQNTRGTLYGSSFVYVGGKANVTSNNSTTVINRAVGGNVFGAGCGYDASSTSGQVTIGTNVAIADNAIIERGVYGGGSYGYTTATSNIYILGGTVNGQNGGVNGTTYQSSITGGVYGGACQNQGGTVNITMTGGLVKGGVYGGSNATGTINNNVTMQINGGQVGTGTGSGQTANIHGGGYGSATRVSQNVEITLGSSCTATEGVTVYGDVYGGSALGYVNGTTATNTYHTYVTLNKGTIYGSLYGGGLGNAGNAANVYGPVQVKVFGGSVKKTDANGANGSGAVYGCNNISGAPQRAVTVDIYGTDPQPSEDEYALFAVYGGGNQASYSYGTPTVTVHNCDNSIEYVYGGGNAAHITNGNTDVTIYGGNKIGNVFGGGNGTVTAANVSGNTNVKIYGGTIGRVFGGSNSQGTIGGTIWVNATAQTEAGNDPCSGNAFQRCAINVDELYGGGNMAASNVGNISIGCMNAGDMINYVYGGSNDADITGNINLTMSGGRVGNLFGGNNTGHSISGSITVNVNWDGSCSNNYLGNVYGGGNLATFGTTESPKAPTVNILNGTVSGNVYGGGKGLATDHTKGQVTGNPQVTVGDNVNGHQVTIAGSVFGGGDAGNVVGTPEVNIAEKCNTTITTAVYGGGNAADVSATNVTINGGTIGDVFGGGNGLVAAANVTGATSLVIHGGTITRVFAGGNTSGTIGTNSGVTINHTSSCDQSISEVYGGGNLAAGNAGTVTIECTAENIGDVYGGANQADVSNDITLNITGGQINNVFGGNNTSGSISGGITVNINKAAACNTFSVNNVYGGGNLAQYTIPNNKALAVNILNGTVSQNVYGGGKGDPDNHNMGKVTGNPVVTIGDAANLNNNNVQAVVTGDVYGGGDAGNVVGTPQVNVINKCNTSIANVYGGGNAADVSGTDVNIDGGNITGMVFGGGHGNKDATPDPVAANVGGNVAVDVTGGTINKVFGGSNSYGNITGTVAVNIDKGTNSCEMHITEVYGGGNEAAGNAGTITIGCTGSATEGIGDVYGGAREANINSDITLTITGGKINNVFGGNNISGSISGGIEVNINWDGSCAQNSIQNVYGGGNLAQYTIPNNKALAVNVLNGTVSGNVYGGGKGDPTDHSKGQVTGNPVVTIGDAANLNNNAVQAVVTGDVYGGGDAGDVEGTPVVNVINKCNTTIGNVYGGGNAADVTGTDVNIDGGTISGMVFGGGHGNNDPTDLKVADVNGSVDVDITGGTINKVFAGSNLNGTITGSVALDINKSTATGACDMIIGEVYGGGNVAAGNAGTITIGCTGDWTTTGTNNHTNHNSTDNRIGYELEGIGTVYGGANQANIGASGEGNESNITLNINSGIVENVFGGNNQSGTIYGTITVNIDSTGTCGWYVGNVYGGGNQATYGTANSNYPQVNISSGLVSGDVFGGGLGSSGTAGQVTGNPQVIVNGAKARVNGGVYGGGSLAPTVGNPLVTLTTGALTNVYGGGKAASITGAPIVNINGGTVSTGVYGGCNTSGNVSGNITVNVTGGTIGSSTNLASYTTADVFGGGFGASTSTSGNVTVNINGSGVNIYGDVYGGSALGDVNDAASDKTTVNILNGTLHSEMETITGGFKVYHGGNVYGGGLGRKAVGEVGDEGYIPPIAAAVNGEVIVNIGSGTIADSNPYTSAVTGITGNATIGGNVYGCNNTNGSPQDNVTVNVFQTAHTEGNTVNDNGYAIANVFGGGNEANYDISGKTATVNIWGCNNTIERTFGGGNAAATHTVVTNIQGGHINQAFGGGNGERGVSYGANVNGDVYLNIHGGHIGQSFGGSNQNGTISGEINIVADDNGPCGSMIVDEFFCGGNFVDITGNVETTITCSQGMEVHNLYGGCNMANISGHVLLNVYGGIYTNVYGGSKGDLVSLGGNHITKAANIGGYVTLNLYGGTIETVYGGSNINGDIEGVITVNVLDVEGECPLYITNIYGGSNLTTYEPSSSTMTSPIVNVVHIKNGISGNVYGGSKGEEGVETNVHSNPLVNIGYDATAMNTYIPSSYVSGYSTLLASPRAIIAGSVFGGGDAAKVTGNTAIYLRNRAKVFGNVYGGGNMGEVTGDTKVIVNGANQ